MPEITYRVMNFLKGKEGCARETQEGCPALFKLTVFRAFLSSENLLSGEKKLFDTLRHGANAPCLSFPCLNFVYCAVSSPVSVLMT